MQKGSGSGNVDKENKKVKKKVEETKDTEKVIEEPNRSEDEQTLKLLLEKLNADATEPQQKNIFKRLISVFTNLFGTKKSDNDADNKLFADKLESLGDFYLKNCDTIGNQAQNGNIGNQLVSFCSKFRSFIDDLAEEASLNEEETLGPESNPKKEANEKKSEGAQNPILIDRITKNKDFKNRLDMLVLQAIYLKNVQKIKEVRENITLKYDDLENPENPSKEYHYKEFEKLVDEIGKKRNNAYKEHGMNADYKKLQADLNSVQICLELPSRNNKLQKMLYDLVVYNGGNIETLNKQDLNDKNVENIEDGLNFISAVYRFSADLQSDKENEKWLWLQDEVITQKYLSKFADNLYKYIKDEEDLCNLNQCPRFKNYNKYTKKSWESYSPYAEEIGRIRTSTKDSVFEKFFAVPQYNQTDDGGTGWGSCFIYALLPQMTQEEFKRIKEYVDQQEPHDIKFQGYENLKLNTSNILQMVRDTIKYHDIAYYEMVVYMRAAIALKWAENQNYVINEKEEFFTVLGKKDAVVNDAYTDAFICASDYILSAVFKLLNRSLTLVTQDCDKNKQFVGHYVPEGKQTSDIYKKYKDPENQQKNQFNFREGYSTWGDYITNLTEDYSQRNQNGLVSLSLKEMKKRIDEVKQIIENDINDPNVISIRLANNHYTPLSKAKGENRPVSSWGDIPKIFKAECVLSDADKAAFRALKINIDTLPLNFCCNPDNLVYIREFADYLNDLQTEDEKNEFMKLVHSKVCILDKNKNSNQNVTSNQQFDFNESVFYQQVNKKLWTTEISNMLSELGINIWPSYGFLLVKNNITALSNIRDLLHSFEPSHIKENFERYFPDLITIKKEEIEVKGKQGVNKQVKKSVAINEGKSLNLYTRSEFGYLLKCLSGKANWSSTSKKFVLQMDNGLQETLYLLEKWVAIAENLSKEKAVVDLNIDSYFPFVLFCISQEKDENIVREILNNANVLQNLLENRIGLENSFFGQLQEKLGKSLNGEQDADNDGWKKLGQFIKFFDSDTLYLFAEVITHKDIKNINALRALYDLPVETVNKLIKGFVSGNVDRFAEIIKMINENYQPSSSKVLAAIIQEADSYDHLKPKLKIFSRTLKCTGSKTFSEANFKSLYDNVNKLENSDILKSNLFKELDVKAQLKLMKFVVGDQNKQTIWNDFVELISKSVNLNFNVELDWFVSNINRIVDRSETFDDLIFCLNNIVRVMDVYNHEQCSLFQKVSFWQSCDVINQNLSQLFNGIAKVQDKQSVSTDDIGDLQKISAALKQDGKLGSMTRDMFWALTNKINEQNENQKLILEKIDQYMFLDGEFEFKGINLFSALKPESQVKFMALTKKMGKRKDKDSNGTDIDVDEKEELKFLINYVKSMMVNQKTNELDGLVIKAADIAINRAQNFDDLNKYLLVMIESLNLPNCRKCFKKDEKLFLDNFNKVDNALLTLSQKDNNVDQEMQTLSKIAESLQESQLGKDLLLVLYLKLDKEKKMIIGKKIDMYMSMIKVKNFGKLTDENKKRLWNNCKVIEDALSNLSDNIEKDIKQSENKQEQNPKSVADKTGYVGTLAGVLYGDDKINKSLTYSLAETMISSKETRNSVFKKIKEYHQQLNQPQPKQEKPDIENSKNDETKDTSAQMTDPNQSYKSV